MSSVTRTGSMLIVAAILFVWSLFNAVGNTLEFRSQQWPDSGSPWVSILASIILFSLVPLAIAVVMVLKCLSTTEKKPADSKGEIVGKKPAATTGGRKKNRKKKRN